MRVQRVIIAVVLIHEVLLVLGGVVGVLDCRPAVESLHFPVLTRLSVPLFLLLRTFGLADVGGVCWGLNRVAKHSRDARRPVVLLQLFFCYLFLVGLWRLLHALFASHGSCLGRCKRRKALSRADLRLTVERAGSEAGEGGRWDLVEIDRGLGDSIMQSRVLVVGVRFDLGWHNHYFLY